jgi:hypothetical protein
VEEGKTASYAYTGLALVIAISYDRNPNRSRGIVVGHRARKDGRFTAGERMLESVQNQNQPSGSAFERHYSVLEIAKLWGLSYNSVKSLFKNEPGVFAIGNEETRYGRARITLRIPQSVMERVHRKRTTRVM